ncbi:hypothetical protein ACLIYM_19570 [Streptomyces fenghuangensis]|uniref:Uncharacterized protein n=1 Tax=Streptomyces chitinivorans TaxID=1257027 RepID=A0ABW7HN32_9ACTN|nr:MULTISPECIES: hypothetical protein [Streptomyces]MCG3040464.1 hypothetical protein [Streptomyces sp. ICN903]MDH2411164.1 hypothetical protein [Streptomyces chitinivorans]
MKASKPSLFRRMTTALGLTHAPGGEPRPGGSKVSRFGRFVSPRLDQELKDLQARVAQLEELLGHRQAEDTRN